MKTILLHAILLLTTVTSLKAQEKYNIITSASTIKWSCDYVFYFNGHHGTINFQEGFFITSNGKIIGGEFTIDMNSIICLDIEDQESNESLVSHIKDPDFFDVASFPTSKLVITKVNYLEPNVLEILANMKIKDKDLPVTFRATLEQDGSQMHTKFKIDRTRWGITYNSNIKDGAISDAIGFEVILKMKPM